MSCGSFLLDCVWFNCLCFRKNSVKVNLIVYEIFYCFRVVKVVVIDVLNFKGVFYVVKLFVIDSLNC